MHHSYRRPIIVFAVCVAVSFIVYYAGPPALWSANGICVLRDRGVEVTFDFPLKYAFLPDGNDSLRSRDRSVWVRIEPYSPLEFLLQDYLYTPDPTRYPYRHIIFNGYDAAAATDDGVLTGAKPTTYVEVPVTGGVVTIDYELAAMSPTELSTSLGSIRITTGHTLNTTSSTCYRPLLPFSI